MAYAALAAVTATGRARDWLRGRSLEWAAGAARRRRRGDGARVERDEGAIRQWVEGARAGDAGAWGELFERLRPDVRRLCARMLGGVDAEDATHDAFLRAQQRIASFDPARPFRPWLLGIASNHCIDALRRRSLEKRIFEPGETDLADPAGSRGSALDGIVRAQGREAVVEALDALPDRYRAPLVLRYFAEQSYDEIGEALALSRSQVATLLFRGKRRLRERLGDDGPGSEETS